MIFVFIINSFPSGKPSAVTRFTGGICRRKMGPILPLPNKYAFICYLCTLIRNLVLLYLSNIRRHVSTATSILGKLRVALAFTKLENYLLEDIYMFEVLNCTLWTVGAACSRFLSICPNCLSPPHQKIIPITSRVTWFLPQAKAWGILWGFIL